MQKALDLWLDFQTRWMYLSGVFSSPEDVFKELKAEAKKFEQVDMSWKKLMNSVSANKRLLVIFEKTDLPQMFESNIQIMEKVLRTLNGFLEVKRQAFPRFYFLSNVELLNFLTSSTCCDNFFNSY